MIQTPSISVVMPALNEENDVRDAIEDTLKAFDDAKVDGELILVNDGSTDSTESIGRSFLQSDSRVKLVKHERPMGIGASFRDGLQIATKDIVVMYPGDNEMIASEMLQYLGSMNHVDIIVPFMVNSLSTRSFVRRFFSASYATVIRLLLKINLRHTNGLVMYRRSILKNIKLRDAGFLYQTELLAKTIKRGYLYSEVPYYIRARKSGDSKAFSFINILKTLKNIFNLYVEIHFRDHRGHSEPLRQDSASYRRKASFTINQRGTMEQEKKSVLLISSWTNSKKVLGYYLSPPIGLYRLKNWLIKKYDIEVLDPNVTDPVEYLKKNPRFKYFGFSPTKDNLHNDITLMKLVKKLYPFATVFAGGVEATCNYQSLFNLNVVDTIIFGEGEKALDQFLQNKEHYNLTPSTITRKYSYDTVLTPEDLAIANDIDYSNIPIKKYWARNAAVTNGDLLSTNCVNMYITNYCPQGCKFCSTTRFIREACPSGSKVVTIPPMKLVELIENVKRQLPETKTIYFHDDNACHYADKTIEWCNEIAKRDMDLTFVASSRINHFKPEVMEAMKKAKFRKLSIGVEAYSDNLLKKVRKGQRKKDIDAFIKVAKDYEMPLNVNLMLCQPEADIDDVKMTAEFCLRVLENKQNSVTAHPFIKAYAGSYYYDNWDLIEYAYTKTPEIEGIKSQTIRIPHRFLPRDKKVRELLEKIDYETQHSEIFIKMRTDSFLMSQYGKELCNLVLKLI